MNKRQKIVQQQFLNNEEAVIGMLEESYAESLKGITKKAQSLHEEIEALTNELDSIEDEAEREVQKSKIRSKVYQKKYQDSLKGQISGILDKMQKEEFKTVSDYLGRCYEDGFVGTMYDLQGQGIPLCFPLDQEAVVRAVQLDSKISQGLYSRLGEDVAVLKKKIASDVTRGIASGMSFKQVAQQIAAKSNVGFNNAVRIARTEGHRIQVQSGMDACYKAKEKGADVVKQWDSTLDAKTRDSHAQVDGEIKELDEKFSNGLMFPGDPSGGAAEVVNCRCALLQRARWALDKDELDTLKERAAFYGLDKADQFDDFKKKYLKAVESEKVLTNSGNSGTMKLPDIQIAKTVGAKAKNYDVLDLQTGEMFHFVEGTRLQDVEVFAGKGSSDVYRMAYKYANTYGGKVEDWQHVKGKGWLATDDGDRHAEVHWSQCEGIGKFDFFVKRWLE